MKLRAVERTLAASGCGIKSDKGPTPSGVSPCGHHSANIPRHTIVSPGVVADTIRRLACLSQGRVAVTTYTVTARQWEHDRELHIDGVGVTQSRSQRSRFRHVP